MALLLPSIFLSTFSFLPFSLSNIIPCIHPYPRGFTSARFTHRRASPPPSAMARRKALLHPQRQDANSSHPSTSTRSPLSAREYYNARYEKIDRCHRSTTLYADVINSYIVRLEGLWREWVISSLKLKVVLLRLLILNLDIATSSISIPITHSKDQWRVESRTSFIEYITTTPSRKLVRLKSTDIN